MFKEDKEGFSQKEEMASSLNEYKLDDETLKLVKE